MTAIAESLVWLDADGREWNLSDPTGPYYVVSPGLDGAYGVPQGIVKAVVPGLAGEREQYVQVGANTIKLPLQILADGLDGVDRARRALAEAMRTTRGVGVLRHTANDGAVRDLYCREVSNFRTIGKRGPSSLLLGLEFYASDPYWRDANPTSITLQAGGTLPVFFNPTVFFPVHIAASGLTSSFLINNDGQATSYPLWIITGPGTNPILTNETTGEVLSLTYALAAGHTLVINTRPDIASVLLDGTTSEWTTVSATSTLWGLAVGLNTVTLAMSDTTSASALQLQYKRKWESV